jgi:predicted nucleic acid-binding Zn ribbon protein
MNCSNCGKQIETDSKFCNGCGHSVEVVARKKTHPLVMTLAVMFGLLVLSFIISAITGNTHPTASDNPAEKQRDEKQFQTVVGGALLLKRSMRNPDSFKVSSVLVIGTETACYEYRAQNGFGGMNVGSAVLALRKNAFKTNEMNGFVQLWNKECAHKSGTD